MEKQINQVCGVNLSIFLYFLQCVDGDKTCHLWTVVDLAFFVLMGVAGGLLGALFNCINKRLAKYRMRNVHPKAKFIRYPREISIMDLYWTKLLKTGELTCSDNRRVVVWRCIGLIGRVLESLLVCMVTTLVIFVASVTLGECRDLVSTNNNTSTQVSLRPASFLSFNFSLSFFHLLLFLCLSLLLGFFIYDFYVLWHVIYNDQS